MDKKTYEYNSLTFSHHWRDPPLIPNRAPNPFPSCGTGLHHSKTTPCAQFFQGCFGSRPTNNSPCICKLDMFPFP